jgi:hypothetical protein
MAEAKENLLESETASLFQFTLHYVDCPADFFLPFQEVKIERNNRILALETEHGTGLVLREALGGCRSIPTRNILPVLHSFKFIVLVDRRARTPTLCFENQIVSLRFQEMRQPSSEVRN